MSQNTSLTTATTIKHQAARKGARLIMMSFKNRMLATIALLALTLGLFSSSRSVLAVSDCQTVKGIENGVINDTGASGVITHGGKLNGTTQNVITSDFTPTPDPNAFSFTDDETITTDKGVLRTHNVTLLDVANGVGSAIARIDPN